MQKSINTSKGSSYANQSFSIEMQIGLASYLKGVKTTFNYPRTNKTVKILGMSLEHKKVCPDFRTYPITELEMNRLIQWHMC